MGHISLAHDSGSLKGSLFKYLESHALMPEMQLTSKWLAIHSYFPFRMFCIHI